MNHIADISEVLLELGLSDSVTETERGIVQICLQKAEAAVRRFLRYDPTQASRTEFYPQADLSRSGRQSVWESTSTDAYLRYLSETSTDELQVIHIPIRSIDALYIDYDGRSGARSGSFGADTLKTEGDDFWMNTDILDSSGNRVCRDGIIRSIGRWPATAGSVKIEYTAGYTADELHGQDSVLDASCILEAVVDEAVRRVKKVYSRMKQSGRGLGSAPLSSETLGEYSYSLDSSIYSRLVGAGFDILPETQLRLEDFVNYGVMISC